MFAVPCFSLKGLHESISFLIMEHESMSSNKMRKTNGFMFIYVPCLGLISKVSAPKIFIYSYFSTMNDIAPLAKRQQNYLLYEQPNEECNKKTNEK